MTWHPYRDKDGNIDFRKIFIIVATADALLYSILHPGEAPTGLLSLIQLLITGAPL